MENRQIWTAFLEPLSRPKLQRPRNEYDVTTIESTPCMSRDLAHKLEQNLMVAGEELAVDKSDDDEDDVMSIDPDNKTVVKGIKNGDVEDKNILAAGENVSSSAIASTRPVTMSSSQLPSGFTGEAISISPKKKALSRPTQQVDHRSTSISKWTFNLFTDYINFQKYVRELELPHQHNDDMDRISQHTSVLYRDVLCMFGVKSLKDCMFRENETRVLLDGILMTLCKELDVHIKMEEQSKLQYLPTGKFDYLLTAKDGKPIGCVEAKCPGRMDRKGFAQAVLELNLVQQLALKKGVNVETTPLFCILSDGYRFVLMQLKGSELLLEQCEVAAPARDQVTMKACGTQTGIRSSGEDRTVPNELGKVIKVRKLEDPADFKLLVSSMSKLITSSK